MVLDDKVPEYTFAKFEADAKSFGIPAKTSSNDDAKRLGKKSLLLCHPDKHPEAVTDDEVLCWKILFEDHGRCANYFYTHSALSRHKSSHKVAKDIKCDKCKFITKYRRSLNYHMRTQHTRVKDSIVRPDGSAKECDIDIDCPDDVDPDVEEFTADLMDLIDELDSDVEEIIDDTPENLTENLKEVSDDRDVDEIIADLIDLIAD
jgi:hypothetical protein